MKKLITLMCFVLLFHNICYANNSTMKPNIDIVKSDSDSLQNDIIIALVLTKLDDAVTAFYSEYVEGTVTIAPYYGVNIVTLNDNQFDKEIYRYKYILTIEVTPYIGAHNSIGKDHITIGINYDGVNVLKFQHIESYEVTHPFLKARIIKPLP